MEMYSEAGSKLYRFGAGGAFILERKRKRHRFQSVALFSICVFILQRQQQRQR